MLLSDNGSGMAPKVVERVGQPFNSSKPEGMGIGLYLAITTAQAMGGSLDVESESEGTCIRLRLPVF